MTDNKSAPTEDEKSTTVDLENDTNDYLDESIGTMSIIKCGASGTTYFLEMGGDHEDSVTGVCTGAKSSADHTVYHAGDWEETCYIFHSVGVPDIISRFENGLCSYCEDSRRIGQDSDSDQTDDVFELWTARDAEGVACPVRLGIDIAQKHSEYHKHGRISRDQMMEELYNREKELGYCD